MNSRRLTASGVVAVAVVAAMIGLLLLVEHLEGSDVALPDELHGLQANDLASTLRARGVDADRAEKGVAATRAAEQFNDRALSDAADGASVSTRSYSSKDGKMLYSVLAVDVDLGPLVPLGGFQDTHQGDATVAQYQHVDRGDRECLVYGTTLRASDLSSVTCQRHSSHLTVRVQSASTTTSIEDTLAVLDDAWDAVH